MNSSDVVAGLAAENPLSDRDAARLDLHLAEAELLEELLSIETVPARPPVAKEFWRSRRPRMRGRVLQAVALSALIAVAVILPWPGSRGEGPAPAVAAALARLSRIAASGPSMVPKAGQYLSVRSVSDYATIADGKSGEECLSHAIDHREVWIAANGSGLLRESSGPATFPTAVDRIRCQSIARGSTAASGPSNLWFADRCFELGPGSDLQSLSTNPRVLLVQMRRIDGGPRTPAEDFVHVGDFLRETDASPRLRAALYKAAALIPGVRLLGVVPDHLGRKGLGIALTDHGVRTELILNRRTAALMGEQATGSHPGDDYWAVYLSSRVVNRQPYPSPVPLRPACHHGAGYSRTVPGGTTMTGAPAR